MVDTGDSFIAIVLGQRDNRSDDSAAPKRPPLNAPWSSRARFGTVMWMPDSAGSRYEPLGVIASGGMATVWRVRDTLLDRVVALKRPHPAPSDDPALQRFRREARLAAGITHPNVITIFDAGEDEIGPFLVMEFVEGPTLAEVGPLEREAAIELVATLAGAVAAVHAAGIIHRDVKPGNVILSPDGPKLTDFGIALEASTANRLTVPGSVLATKSYAAPEVLAGTSVGEAADVYALGVILHELTSGATPTGRTLAAIGEPQLDAILARVLSVDPSLRPPAAELARLLEDDVMATLALPVMEPVGLGSEGIPASTEPTRDETVIAQDGAEGTEKLATPILQEPPPAVGEGAAIGRSGVLALAALVVVASAAAFVTGRAVLSAGDTTMPASTATASTVSPPLSAAPTVIVIPSTTAPSMTSIDPVGAAESELRRHLGSIPASDLKPKDAREMEKRLDSVLESWADGNNDQTESALNDLGELIVKHIDSRSARNEALALLGDLARAMDVSLKDDFDD
jgi:eukaryotic-like serine/threonine-protein kinase